MITQDDAGRLVNRFWLFGESGAVAATYDKTHLFEPMDEHRYLQGGTLRVRVPVGPFTAALSLCYDLRFPEMYRLDALDGANLFLVASAWPTERIDTMRLLARTRAVENQAFLVLCNRSGGGRDGTEFGGRSAIIGPDGATLAEAGEATDVVMAELSPFAVSAARKAIPLFGQRRAGVDWRL
jgi:predicted amidohydrolase